WPRELTFWWPEQRFLMGTMKWLRRWTACEPASSSGRNNLKASSHDDINKGVIYATWNDWSWKNGGKHGAAAAQRRSSRRGVRQVAESSDRIDSGESRWLLLARGPREETREASGGLVNGPGGSRGQDDRRPPAARRRGRDAHRRWQFLLRGRHRARQGTGGEAHPLRGRGNERRCLGPGARLLHDDWW